MLALLQRVKFASVTVNDMMIGSIKQGLLVFLAVERNDTTAHAEKICKRILGYRIFADEHDRMNLSVKDINGGILIIPQFTLAADTNSGMRPSFTSAADPQLGYYLFTHCVHTLRTQHANVATGEFGANMQINLCNDGPATFLLTT